MSICILRIPDSGVGLFLIMMPADYIPRQKAASSDAATQPAPGRGILTVSTGKPELSAAAVTQTVQVSLIWNLATPYFKVCFDIEVL